ncbi:SRPBCC domain-containing protein [Arthrobacter antibioticus]|uniref:SRPBCC domain-containing protein n=1 Tax=Arthrobacter sp. H35-MC1 TaxID=3046203 RepID=UPI0024B89FD9|nr:SRPBCC domain-containing protein [Arthrobacter sp. H35-MC1]MDJ0317952.1 SRPBCC domain-containing protein [Arthrobacter sp. H35-MC1]
MATDSTNPTDSTNASLNKDMTRFPLGAATALEDERTQLTLVRHYQVAPEVLWSMFTDPEKTIMWWAKVRGSIKTGSSFDLKWLNVKDEGHGIETDWWYGRVIEADEPRVLEISNSMHGRIRLELTDTEQGTQLVFSNAVEVPVEIALMSLAGWHVHLDHLQEALDGKSIHWQHWWDDFYPCWERVHALYTAV